MPFAIVTQHKKVLMIYVFRRVVVELLLHNLEINFQSPKNNSGKNERKKYNKKQNNYVVAEKLMLANVSMTKWNQLEFLCLVRI